jgi:hypothetical protein
MNVDYFYVLNLEIRVTWNELWTGEGESGVGLSIDKVLRNKYAEIVSNEIT